MTHEQMRKDAEAIVNSDYHASCGRDGELSPPAKAQALRVIALLDEIDRAWKFDPFYERHEYSGIDGLCSNLRSWLDAAEAEGKALRERVAVLEGKYERAITGLRSFDNGLADHIERAALEGSSQ